jgi:hypothetical protein
MILLCIYIQRYTYSNESVYRYISYNISDIRKRANRWREKMIRSSLKNTYLFINKYQAD